MNNILNIKTPAQSTAQTRKADYNLSNLGVTNLHLAYWNLPYEALHEEASFRSEGVTVHGGPYVAFTGKHTARSANDKFVVREVNTEGHVWWGQYNRPMSGEKFEELYARLLGYLQGRDLFVQDVYAGADENYRLPVRIATELAWHSMFVRNMFILPESLEEYKRFIPDFTIVAVPGFKSDPRVDNTNSETFIALSFEKKLAIIGNSAYAGEIKKSVFTILNYLLPLEGVLSMHCSANVNPQDENDVALFFGLSGTGKTTLSADPTRRLIGDDEHGWSDEGVFNFEGGCYAKVIGLSESAEPEIYATTHMYGTILENVTYDPVTRLIDLDDESVTENTRASYPLEFISNAVPEKKAGHPKNVIMLTCDASGVMPPIARLTPDQALYQFISGTPPKWVARKLVCVMSRRSLSRLVLARPLWCITLRNTPSYCAKRSNAMTRPAGWSTRVGWAVRTVLGNASASVTRATCSMLRFLARFNMLSITKTRSLALVFQNPVRTFRQKCWNPGRPGPAARNTISAIRIWRCVL